MHSTRKFIAFATAVLFTWPAHGASTPEGTDGAATVGATAKVQQQRTGKGLAHDGRLRASRAHASKLDAPLADAAAAMAPRSKDAPLQVGFGRDLTDLATEAATRAAMQWEQLADGTTIAAVRITSTGAAAIRAAMRVRALPADAIVRFHSAADPTLFEVSGADVMASIAGNEAAGDRRPEAQLYWSPLAQGDTIDIEVQLPRGTAPEGVRIAFPHVSHLVTSAEKDFAVPTKAASASCEVDAMCSPAWASQMNAVARMLFSDASGTYLCTGTLLADQDTSSDIPYFLSASHCISNQTAASSLSTYWFYRSASCGANTLGPAQQLIGGATLLYASAQQPTPYTDTSFMRLNNPPPTGAVYAGWLVGASPAGVGSSATGLHHPLGDWLKISSGAIDSYVSCQAPASGGFTCTAPTANATGTTFYDVRWTSGITEPGSSGSGLFNGNGLVVGQLYGGTGGCTTPGDDVYGRLDVAYNAAGGLKQWLSAPAQSLTVTKTGSGTVASAPSGISCGTTCAASFSSGTAVTLTATPASGWVFAGWTGACTGTATCSVTVNGATNVAAMFINGSATLSVSTAGSGTITSAPAGISCGSTCSASYAVGTVVTLSAAPATGMKFTGWGGACSGTGTCAVTMNAATSVSASFAAATPSSLTLTASPNPSAMGQAVSLTATVSGSSPTGLVAFFADGNFVDGCASVALVAGVASCSVATLASGAHSMTASYGGDASNTQSSSNAVTQTVSGTPPPSRLANLSTRARVLTGNDVMIAGFIIGGSSNKTVVVTATGPSLAAAGIANPLSNPTLTLVRSSDGAVIAANDDWQSAPNAAQIQSLGFAPGNALESAVLVSLAPGAYTAIVSGVGGGTGVAIVAAYEIDHPDAPLVNLSTRARVLTGNDVMIAGFIVRGSAPQQVVITVAGPSLVSAGIANALANPALMLVRSSDQTVVASNDDWGSAPNAAQIKAAGFAPASPLESAIMVTLDPGAYTAVVSGAGGTTGVAIVGVYATP